jgi:hypothetical protein
MQKISSLLDNKEDSDKNEQENSESSSGSNWFDEDAF